MCRRWGREAFPARGALVDEGNALPAQGRAARPNGSREEVVWLIS